MKSVIQLELPPEVKVVPHPDKDGYLLEINGVHVPRDLQEKIEDLAHACKQIFGVNQDEAYENIGDSVDSLWIRQLLGKSKVFHVANAMESLRNVK